MPQTYQLGVNGLFHDASVCLLVDGRPRLVIEEERLDRVKHSARFPERGIELCLRTAGITLRDVSDVAFSWQPLSFLRTQVRLVLANMPESLNLFARGASEVRVAPKIRLLLGMKSYLTRRFDAAGAGFKLHFVGHHTAHAYDAYSFSPFEEACVLVIDGFGEVASTSCFVVNPHGMRHLFSIPYPHSVGMLYGAVTEFLGFRAINDEYKVMGLSAYGEDRYRDAFERLLLQDSDGLYRLDLTYFKFQSYGRNRWFADRFHDLLGAGRQPDEPVTDRHQDIACSVQRTTERCGIALARRAYELAGSKNLCIVGGVGQNVCMNARILEDTPFEHVFVPPAPYDAGTSHGAIQAIRARHPGWRTGSTTDAFLGPVFSRGECAAALERHRLSWIDAGSDTSAVVRLLVEGKLIGIFQGRMEFGARALGSRSIVADPRRAEVRDHLNATIKRREGFRPFAPAVVEEHAGEFFESTYPSPFMSFVARVRAEKQSVIPAVVHVDGTARVQTVRREENPFFWQLITDFGHATGVPVLLNTSFNENEPIVCSPDEAIDCFRRTPLDALYLEGLLVTKDGR